MVLLLLFKCPINTVNCTVQKREEQRHHAQRQSREAETEAEARGRGQSRSYGGEKRAYKSCGPFIYSTNILGGTSKAISTLIDTTQQMLHTAIHNSKTSTNL